MRREPALTFSGALRILGKYEPGAIAKLDTALGGAILAAGVGAGLVAVGATALAPLAMLAPIWGWVDQKNEAAALLRKALGGLSTKLAGVSGQERRQLIAAAHTTIIAAAFFDVLEEQLGEKAFASLAITAEEKDALVMGRQQSARTLIDRLYDAEVPAPSPSRGFEENTQNVKVWLSELAIRADEFFSGLAVWQRVAIDWDTIVHLAVERYRSHYLSLAATVPEFLIWAELGEHAATRTGMGEIRSDLMAAFQGQRDALLRLESLLSLVISKQGVYQDLSQIVWRANRGVLDQPIVPGDADLYGVQVTFPAIGKIFVSPAYRISRMNNAAQPANEQWWGDRPNNDDLDVMLAAYALATDATRLPLLLLGHPGAGKSMLTKVFAAQLPPTDYTVVRVPLRAVGANAPILDQIQQALDQATNRRVEWAQLADQTADTVRVVLLDGLDELLQASNSDRSGYLQEVVRFQQIEGDQGRPVIVMVTSRTVVADRVDIPDGTTIVKLDDFDEPRIAAWLDGWREANADAIAARKVHELSLQTALHQPDLARQPLLLLMLAIYSADPKSPPLDRGLSTSSLYKRLFDNFARREVNKKAEANLRQEELDARVEDQLHRLSVAALAMFNRGVQYITEAELGADLVALDERSVSPARSDELGKRLLGEFFFVHASEATLLGADDQGSSVDEADVVQGRRRAERSYEFLHATFGEYLVAQRVIEVLRDMAQIAFGGRRGYRDPEDDLLFALLSHQPLAVRRSALVFAIELFNTLPNDEREGVLTVLGALAANYRWRHISDKYSRYQPVPIDRVRQLAAYSANAILLRVALDRDSTGVPIDSLFGGASASDSKRLWRSTVTLWRSGLDADGWHAMLASVALDSNRVVMYDSRGTSELTASRREFPTAGPPDFEYARLIDDSELAARIRLGAAMRNGHVFYDGRDWADAMRSWMVPTTLGFNSGLLFEPPPPGTSPESMAAVARAIIALLRARDGDYRYVRQLLQLLFSFNLPPRFQIDTYALAISICRSRSLVGSVPQLQDLSLYQDPMELLFMMKTIQPKRDARRSEEATDSNDEWDALLERLENRYPEVGEIIAATPVDVFDLIDRVIEAQRDITLLRYRRREEPKAF